MFKASRVILTQTVDGMFTRRRLVPQCSRRLKPGRKAAALLPILCAFLLVGCTETFVEAIDAVEGVATNIDIQSGNWLGELDDLQTTLDQLSAKTLAGGQSAAADVLGAAAADVRSLASDTITMAQLSTDEAIARFGAETRCNVQFLNDFLTERVRSTLDSIAARFDFFDKNRRLPPPPARTVCQVLPDRIALNATDNGTVWSVDANTRTLSIYGYDFHKDTLPTVHLLNRDGTSTELNATVVYVTRYQINIDLSGADFSAAADGASLELRWPGVVETNAVTVVLIRPAQLRIVDVQLSNSTPRALVDPVSARVKIANDGGLPSASTSLDWQPSRNALLSALVPSVAPGDTVEIVVGAYTFEDIAGTVQTTFTLGSMDFVTRDLVVGRYRNVERTYELGFALTGLGRHDLPPLSLGQDCVLDTSKGGGSINGHSSIAYAVPAGFGFDFETDLKATLWDSLGPMAARYEQQQTKVFASVELVTPRNPGSTPRMKGRLLAYMRCPN